jgi:hypothetical protein
VDEFELIEQMIHKGILEAGLLGFWRGLIQTYPWYVMCFAGLHTLREMTHDYWHPLFGSVQNIPVSFLPPAAAEQLITNPAPDFTLDYDDDVIATIIALTNGQPYLIQLICHNLVTRFNRQNAEAKGSRERRFSMADLDAVIHAAELFHDGNAYFFGIWRQAETTKPTWQTRVLQALQPQGSPNEEPAGMTCADLARASSLSQEATQQALETLQRHDIVRLTPEDERFVYTVELMRRWVAQRQVPPNERTDP